LHSASAPPGNTSSTKNTPLLKPASPSDTGLPSWQRRLLRSAPASLLFAGLRWTHRRKLLVLTYHSVVDAPAAEAARRRYAPLYRNAVSAERFERQMRFLKDHYHLAGSEDLRAFLDGAALPEPSVLLTFDDGLINNYTVAWPILRRLGLPAFFFLPTAFLDDASDGTPRSHWSEAVTALLLGPTDPDERRRAVREVMPHQAPPPNGSPETLATQVVTALKALPDDQRRRRVETLRARLDGLPPSALPADREGHSVLETMTWTQAREMADEGAVMGAHGVSHAILSRLPEPEAQAEIRRSVARVEEQIGRTCDVFAYPNGAAADFTPAHERALADAGCRAAFTQIRGVNAPAPSRPTALRRIDVSSDHGLGAFQYVSSGAKQLVDRFVRGR